MIRSLKWYISATVASVVLLSAASVATLAYYRGRAQVVGLAGQQIDAFHLHFLQQMELKANDLLLTLEVLLSDPTLARDFAAGDRAALAARLLPQYEERMRGRHDITQFHFHKPPAISFLRLHRPEKFGDDLSAFRPSLVQANTRKETVVGIEVTRSGPGLKVVSPVSFQGRHVGSVEFATSLPRLLDNVAGSVAVHYAIGLDEEVWTQARCADLLEPILERENLIYYSASSPDALDLVSRARDRLSGLSSLGSRRFAASRFVLRDFRQQKVGQIAVFKEITDEMVTFQWQMLRTVLIVGALGLVVSGIVYKILLSALFDPLDEVIEVARQIEGGELAGGERIRGRMTTDRNLRLEIRRLFESFAEMVAYLGRMAWTASEISLGDLSVEIRPVSKADTFGLSFQAMVAAFRDVLGAVQEAALKLEAAADQVTSHGDQMRGGTHEQFQATQLASRVVEEISLRIADLTSWSHSLTHDVGEASTEVTRISLALADMASTADGLEDLVTHVGSAVDEVVAGTSVIKKRVAEVDAATQSAARVATQGGQTMRESLDQIDRFSREIAEIIGILNGLSEQTGLIAINAAIQAARAGKAGKGFAVVAERVKELAESSKEAAHRVETLIQAVQSSTTTGVELSERILGQMVSSVDAAADLVGQVTRNMSEQETSNQKILAVSDETKSRVAEFGRELRGHAAGAEAVANDVENMDRLSQRLAELVAVHERGGQDLADSFFKIQRVARENLEGGDDLVAASGALREEAKLLKKVANAFRL